jgi:lipopolysaccharide/colanic/teichoic acid biosynthesis glycosyltransferase
MEKYLYKCYIPSTPLDISFLEKIKSFNKTQKIVKIAIDYSISTILLTIATPIILYSIYRIKKESKGDIFYTQKRIGLNGKPFICYKFRSMHENSPHDPYTREDDNRIFPWGKIMRKTRIDELPQIWNILKGDMSLIGPRAEWNILVKKYEKKIPYYQERHLVKPGITGWAQVNYPYGVNSFDAKQKLMYDFYYIKNWSLGLEIKIVWRTIFVMMFRRGK